MSIQRTMYLMRDVNNDDYVLFNTKPKYSETKRDCGCGMGKGCINYSIRSAWEPSPVFTFCKGDFQKAFGLRRLIINKTQAKGAKIVTLSVTIQGVTQ